MTEINSSVLLVNEGTWEEAKENDQEHHEEFHHRLHILKTLFDYRSQSYSLLKKKQHFLSTLPPHQRHKLMHYQKHLEVISLRLHYNALFIEQLFNETKDSFREELEGFAAFMDKHFKQMELQSIEPIEWIFKQLVREWSNEGKMERITCFSPIIDEIKRRFPGNRVGETDESEVKILFPGAGLCRLPYEVACLGYNCEAIDCSILMMSAAKFILNIPTKRNPREYWARIFPFVHESSNVKFNADQIQSVYVPDVLPVVSKPKISLKCGDFIGLYREISEEYDCVVTSFFIDCPRNALDVVETIYRLLKADGVWINNGPLKYHFSEKDPGGSIQLTRQDLRQFIIASGFYFEIESDLPSGYFECSRSMEQRHYQSWFFVCSKRTS